ncbi:MAG: glycogen synthase GlgA [Pirellulaceae bacterium]
MNVVIASSEVTPFSKTGGLADVCGALPLALAKRGAKPMVITPAYRCVLRSKLSLERTDVDLNIPIGSKVVRGGILKTVLPDSDIPVYFVEQPTYFDRHELYREAGEDYKDNCERFVFFCRAVMQTIQTLDLPVDILHCNDWQTGLIPAYLRVEYERVPGFEHMVSLLTIHNLAYQGCFWHWDMLLTGLDWKYFNWRQMEFFDHLNLLKTGIVFADAVSTVSPRYAEEIQGQPLGCGLDDALKLRRDVLYGVINGVDYGVWNPEIDPYLSARYDVTNWIAGKAANKASLRSEMGLPASPSAPLIGLVGRLADQKGWDLVAAIMKRWVRDTDVQWVILGTGEPVYHQLLYGLAKEHPDKVAVRLEFSDRLANQIEAGADIFLMPSLYEPCGLNQLYSLQYGTVPLVRETGGLADSIRDASSENLASGIANGFSFQTYDGASLEETLRHACSVFLQQPHIWKQLVETGMRQDLSWVQSAKQYIDIYKTTLRKRNEVPA